MTWQELGVAAIVAGAVLFLARRLFGRFGPKPKGTTTFVPLAKMRSGPGTGDGPGCH